MTFEEKYAAQGRKLDELKAKLDASIDARKIAREKKLEEIAADIDALDAKIDAFNASVDTKLDAKADELDAKLDTQADKISWTRPMPRALPMRRPVLMRFRSRLPVTSPSPKRMPA